MRWPPWTPSLTCKIEEEDQKEAREGAYPQSRNQNRILTELKSQLDLVIDEDLNPYAACAGEVSPFNLIKSKPSILASMTEIRSKTYHFAT
jgi:hypothetical protein